jgi:hypothetical protein
MRPALPGIGPATTMPATGRAGTKAAGAKTADATAAAAKPVAVAAADGGADDEVPRWAAKALEQLLHVTCWLDPGEDGERLTTTVRFTGQRTDVTGKPGPGDTFTQEETYQGIVPGSGPVALTRKCAASIPARGRSPRGRSAVRSPVSRHLLRPQSLPPPAGCRGRGG